MSMYGIDVDARSIASGVYSMMDTSARAGLAVGLVPLVWKQRIDDALRHWFESHAIRQAANRIGVTAEQVRACLKEPVRGCANREMREAWVEATSRDIVVALLDAALKEVSK